MTQVTSLHAVELGASPSTPFTVKNLSATTVYYRSKLAVSEGTNDGSLAENAEATFINRTLFITSSGSADISVTPAEISVGGTGGVGNLPADSVTETKIGAEAVDEDSLKNEAVSSGKTKLATIPVPPAGENAQVLGVAGVPRKITVGYTGNNVETKVIIKHQLGTQSTLAFAQKVTAKLPAEQPTTPLGKWVPANENEGTYTFTAAPAAKEEMFITVLG